MSNTGAEGLDFVIEQVWGQHISNGSARAILGGPVPPGWEVREQYWAVPTAASAQLLVPQNRRVAPRALADYAALRGPKVRILRRALAAAVSAGVPLSRDSLRIIAPVGSPAVTVAEIGARVGHSDVLATFGVRTAANAKPTLELRTPDGEAVGFVKLAWNDVTTRAIENEASSIRLMGDQSRAEIKAPVMIADGLIGGRQFVITEPLPRGIRHVPGTYSSLSDGEALGPGTVVRRQSIGNAGQVRLVQSMLDVEPSVTPVGLIARARDLASRVVASDVVVPVANFWHGDFTWWNTGRDPIGRLWLFDWETAEQDAPAGMDTVHWYAHTKDAENALSVVPRVGAAVAHSGRLLRSLGHSRRGVAVLAAWYAVTLAANEIRLAESLGSWDRIKHSPEILDQLLGWGLSQIAEAG